MGHLARAKGYGRSAGRHVRRHGKKYGAAGAGLAALAAYRGRHRIAGGAKFLGRHAAAGGKFVGRHAAAGGRFLGRHAGMAGRAAKLAGWYMRHPRGG